MASGVLEDGLDGDVEELARRIVDLYHRTLPEKRLLVSIAGIPGSGKSTLAYPLTDRINALLSGHPAPHPSHPHPNGVITSPDPAAGSSSEEVAICVGLDGWHYSREKLDTFDDPKEAHWLRGAAFTFELASYLSFLLHLSLPLVPDPPNAIPFPTFDHALKDPCPSLIPVLPRHRIILIEGLYCHLSTPGWKECSAMFDLKVWVDVPYEVARERVIKRNFEAGIVDDIDRCAERVDAVDMMNARMILDNRIEADVVVRPVDRHPTA